MRIRLDGMDKALRLVVKLQDKTADFTVAFGELNANLFQPMFRKRFESEGAFPDGNRWAALAPSTVRRRQSRPGGNRGGVLVDFGDLRASLEKLGPESVFTVEPLKMERGTSRPGAEAHQEGGRLPERQIIPDPMPQSVLDSIEETLFAHLDLNDVG